MKRCHLLRFQGSPDEVEPLVAAARELGLAIGWLDEAEVGVEGPLSAAAATGMLRAVSVGRDCAVVVKPRRGPAVLRDLLREHFRGCALVLVRGPSEGALARDLEGVPTLVKQDGSFTVANRGWSPESLAAALRRARPFSAAAVDES